MTVFPRKDLNRVMYFISQNMLQKLTRCLYKVNENLENISGNEKSAIFDRSLASEIETNVLKALKVVTMSEV